MGVCGAALAMLSREAGRIGDPYGRWSREHSLWITRKATNDTPMSRNVSSISFRQGELDNNLFERIVGRAEEAGTAVSDNLRDVAREFLVGDALTLGAASFYDFLKEENAGKKAHVCNGTACMVAGTQDAVHEGLRKHFAEDEIGHICCLGRCHENGSFYYKGANYSSKTTDEIDALIERGEGSSPDKYAVGSNMDPPVLIGEFHGVDPYYGLLKDLLARDPEGLLEELKAASLRGRGGAGFPAGVKWAACRAAKGEPKYIVCNADEGDPGAYIDRYLMEEQPHSVLFGMLLAGYLVGSEVGVLYIRYEYPDSIRIIEEAIRDLQTKGIVGENIFGTDFNFKFKIVKGAGAYICGEETALLASIEGNRPEVRVRPPYPIEYGLFGRPTVVNNVETFACIHTIYEIGGEAFGKLGRGRSTGPKLVSLDGNFNKPGLYEVKMGTPFSDVIYEMGGGFRVPVKALQVGGPLGGIVPVGKIGDLTLDFESFNENGFLLGHASIVAIPESFPMIKFIEHLFEFTAAESCGKCFPCRLGSVRGMELAEKARTSDYKIDPQLMTDLLDTMEETSLCALGGGVPLPIKNAIHHFQDELKPYFQ